MEMTHRKRKTDGMTPVSFSPLRRVCQFCHLSPSIYHMSPHSLNHYHSILLLDTHLLSAKLSHVGILAWKQNTFFFFFILYLLIVKGTEAVRQNQWDLSTRMSPQDHLITGATKVKYFFIYSLSDVKLKHVIESQTFLYCLVLWDRQTLISASIMNRL